MHFLQVRHSRFLVKKINNLTNKVTNAFQVHFVGNYRDQQKNHLCDEWWVWAVGRQTAEERDLFLHSIRKTKRAWGCRWCDEALLRHATTPGSNRPNFKEAMLSFSKGMSLDDEVEEFPKTDVHCGYCRGKFGQELLFQSSFRQCVLYGVIQSS